MSSETPGLPSDRPPSDRSPSDRAPSDRTTLKRGANRAAYAQDDVKAVLDAGLVAHVGVNTEHGVIVLPMAYGRTDDTIYLHGSAANAMLRAGADTDICVTVTLVDGLVVARSAFHNSMNYRSVVIRGHARRVTDDAEILSSLKIITDHVADNWDSRREATDKELKATLVIALPLAEASAKIRTGGPVDDEIDEGGPEWAGVIPLTESWGEAIPIDDLVPYTPVPTPLAALRGVRSQT